MLNKEIREELVRLQIAEEEIQRAERVIAKYSTINREMAKSLYENTDTRRSMKAKNMWDSKTTGIEMQDRYLGNAECEVVRQKLWIKEDKIRIYFDIEVDGLFKETGNWIKIA